MAMFSKALNQTNKELHSHKNGLIIVFKRALGIFVSIENPSDNSGIIKPLFVSTFAIKREKVCCLFTI